MYNYYVSWLLFKFYLFILLVAIINENL
jgi:hypothetical protein